MSSSEIVIYSFLLTPFELKMKYSLQSLLTIVLVGLIGLNAKAQYPFERHPKIAYVTKDFYHGFYKRQLFQVFGQSS